MSWQLDDEEFESVSVLPPEERYQQFVKRVAQWGILWGLSRDTSWAVKVDDKGYTVVPVWPHERFAAACSSGYWYSHIPRSIPLQEWMERWLPGLQRDQQLVLVFPTFNGRGVPVAPERLKADLEAELARMEEGGRGSSERA
jgi:Protein of unknown function (DUF2750)